MTTTITREEAERITECFRFSSSKTGYRLYGIKCGCCDWKSSEFHEAKWRAWQEWDAHFDASHGKV